MSRAKKQAKPGTGKDATLQRNKRFVDAYFMNNQNQTQACIAMGYSPRSAGTQGTRLMKDAGIQEMVAARSKELAAKFSLSAEMVTQFWARTARLDISQAFDKDGHLLPIHEWPEDLRLLCDGFDVKELEGRGKWADRTWLSKVEFPKRAAVFDQMARHFGMYAKDKAGAGSAMDDEAPPAVSVTIDFKDARRKPR